MNEKYSHPFEQEIFSIVGAVFQSPTGPSIGTPIFRDSNNKGLFVQNFDVLADKFKISNFTRIADIDDYTLEVEHFINNGSSKIGDKQQLALRIHSFEIKIFTHDEISDYVISNYNYYKYFPFFLANLYFNYESPTLKNLLLSNHNDPLSRFFPKLFDESIQSWTDDRVERLIKLWSDNLSASRIAAELRGVTRNAVLGKAHRLGLTRTSKVSSLANFDANPAINKKNEVSKYKFTLKEPIPLKIDINELNETTCKWPFGDPSSNDFGFCGHKCDDGSPYCSYHTHQLSKHSDTIKKNNV